MEIEQPLVSSQPETIYSPAKIKLVGKRLIICLQLIISIGIPLLALLAYQIYAERNGIKLEDGCEGPGNSFAIMSGILFAFQLRLNLGEETTHAGDKNGKK